MSQYTGGHSVVSHFFPTPSTFMSSSNQGLSVQGRVQAVTNHAYMILIYSHMYINIYILMSILTQSFIHIITTYIHIQLLYKHTHTCTHTNIQSLAKSSQEYSALLSSVTTYGHTVKLFGPTLSHFLRSPRFEPLRLYMYGTINPISTC